jgi:hypothetical protein
MRSIVWQDLLLGASFVLLALALRSEIRRRRLRTRFMRASEAERAAAAHLKRLGFRIIEIQPMRQAKLRVGSRLVHAAVRADYLVRKRFRRFVVEVKSGELAPDPSSGSTRRQLREYRAVFRHPILLLDASTGTVSSIEFLDEGRRRWASRVFRFFVAVLTWWLLYLAFP